MDQEDATGFCGNSQMLKCGKFCTPTSQSATCNKRDGASQEFQGYIFAEKSLPDNCPSSHIQAKNKQLDFCGF